MKHSRQTVVDVLREVSECMEKHRVESFREYARQRLPAEALEAVEAELFKHVSRALEAHEALLCRFEKGEIDLDEYCRRALVQAAEQGEQIGSGIIDSVTTAMRGRG